MTEEIIVSLITSIITWTILTFGKNVLIPFYETIVYKGVNISGTWTKTSKLHGGTQDETTYTESIILEQNANRIKGSYTVVSLFSDSRQVVSSYNLKGDIKDGHLILTADIADKKQIGYGAFVLKIIAGGQQMIGVVTLLNRIGDNIVTYDNCCYDKTI
jgi:hypothetical protein